MAADASAAMGAAASALAQAESMAHARSKRAIEQLPADQVIDKTTGARITLTVQDLGGETECYKWGQSRNQLIVQTLLPDGITSKEVSFAVTTGSVSLSVCDQTLVDGQTYARIIPDECTYTLEDEPEEGGRRLAVILTKKIPTAGCKHWPCVVLGEPEIDVQRFANHLTLLGEDEDARGVACEAMGGIGQGFLRPMNRRELAQEEAAKQARRELASGEEVLARQATPAEAPAGAQNDQDEASSAQRRRG